MAEHTNMQGIYQILYKGNCAYVGSSLNIQRRFHQHKDTLKRKVHCNFILQRMWNKNEKDFIFHILEEVSDNSLLMEKEQYHIDTLKPFTNLSKANGSHPHTEETKQKMRGRIVSEKTRKIMSEQRKGKSTSKKGTKTGIIPRSAFKKGNIPWNKGTKGLIVSWNKGKKLSKEHKLALSDAKREKYSYMIGQTFGKWTVLGYANNREGVSYFKCRCSCSREKEVSGTHLRLFHSNQCRSCAGKQSLKNLSESRKGEKHPFFGKKHSEESRQKIREARARQIITPEHKMAISNSLKGKNTWSHGSLSSTNRRCQYGTN